MSINTIFTITLVVAVASTVIRPRGRGSPAATDAVASASERRAWERSERRRFRACRRQRRRVERARARWGRPATCPDGTWYVGCGFPDTRTGTIAARVRR